MNSASRACRSTRHRSTAPVTRSDAALAHERQVNLISPCSRGHSSRDIGTQALRTACPALRNVVQDAEDWVPDLRSVVQQGVFAGQGAFGAGALFSSRTGCHLHGPTPSPCPHNAVARGGAQALLPSVRVRAALPQVDERSRALFLTSADESTPRRNRSRRNTRHVCLRQPMSTPATLIHKACNEPQSPDPRRPRRCTGGP